MRWPRAVLPRKTALVAAAFLIIWCLVAAAFLPYDNPFVLFVRFTTHRVLAFLRATALDERWLWQPPTFPISIRDDAALVVKTGYGTRQRLTAQLDGLTEGKAGIDLANVLVVADFSAAYTHQERPYEVHDMLAAVKQNHIITAAPDPLGRLSKYDNMTAAILSGSERDADEISKAIGWELDAIKFIPALDLAYRTFPDKKWYIIIDDDTYIVRPSLELLLGHMDPAQPIYLGNSVGDYRGRFAHGGSSFALSHGSMRRLLGMDAHLVPKALVESLTETWGDKLVATTFMKVGVYLDERYSHFFNGERPLITRILSDRFCSPIVSFHGLAEEAQMRDSTAKFRDAEEPVVWNQLWASYEQPRLETMERNPYRLGYDHVGHTSDRTTTTTDVASADSCLAACERQSKACLAWTWDSASNMCHTSPWIIIGEDDAHGKYSGLNIGRVKGLVDRCRTLVQQPLSSFREHYNESGGIATGFRRRNI